MPNMIFSERQNSAYNAYPGGFETYALSQWPGRYRCQITSYPRPLSIPPNTFPKTAGESRIKLKVDIFLIRCLAVDAD